MSIHRAADRSRHHPTTTFFALLGILAIGGCSELPLSPGGVTGSDSMEGISSVETLGTLTGGKETSSGKTEKTSTFFVQQRVGKLGGTILLDGNDLTLVFPPKALNSTKKTIRASIQLNNSPDLATRVDFDFQPSSLKLRKPVQLTISSTYLVESASSYKFWYLDPISRRWQLLDEKKTDPGTFVVFNLYRLGVYAVSR